jgi:hypothetical protein
MKDQVQLLIKILFDETSREDERDDTAIDLRAYKDIRALETLAKIASDPNEDDMIIDTCAESLAEICVAMNLFHEHLFRKMLPFAQRIVFGFVMAKKPELINQSLKNELIKKYK